MGHNDVLVKDLRDVLVTLRHNIEDAPEGNRTARVVGVCMGTGCGNSHLLLEALKILKCHGIYITYNLAQSLKYDIDCPDKTASLRIILRLAAVPNSAFPYFFDSHIGSPLLELDASILRQFAVHQLGKINESIFIGVDEVMELEFLGTIRRIVSELGEIAAECFKSNNHQLVSVFVTSLRSSAFFTSSGRPLILFTPPIADESAVPLVLREYLHGKEIEKCKSLVISAAGFQF